MSGATIQLVIDTGGGTMHPVSDDHSRYARHSMDLRRISVAVLEMLHNLPAGEAANRSSDPNPRTVWWLR